MTTGEMVGCQVAKETSPGDGFGQAAVDLAQKHRAAPQATESIVELAYEWWPPLDKQPDWLKRPNAEDLAAVWPAAAWKAGKGGKATISCLVTVHGLLMDCIVLSESPGGMGFGASAIALTPQFVMRPGTRNGQPTPSSVRIPVDFASPGVIGGNPMAKRMLPVIQAWPEAPSYADVVAIYPQKAKAEKRGGLATVACEVRKTGRLEVCNILVEQPTGQGFGRAARELARKFYVETKGPDGKVQDDLAVQLSFAFDPAMLDTPLVGKPSWIALPPIEDFDAAFGALMLQATARAQLDCEVVQGGSLKDCKMLSESNPGVGAAALALAPKFKLSTWTAEGLPTVGGRVRVPIRFDP
jgi:TonB family protein